MLTVYVMNGDNPSLGNIERLYDSLPMNIVDNVHILPDRELWRMATHLANGSKWYSYFFSSEYLDELLSKNLSLHLEYGERENVDYHIFWKKNWNEGKPKFYRSPRVFASHVKLQEGLMVPSNMENLKPSTILDGWILEC